MPQPGYDALADQYAAMFPEPYQTPFERHAVEAFVDVIRLPGTVVDVGCGLGHVTHDLARRGLDVLGCDPSAAMLTLARNAYPHLRFIDDDAALTHVDDPIAAIIARFSLIHLPPDRVAMVLRSWASRLRPDTPVLIAVQSSDTPGPPTRFDHAVAPAWRWHADELGRALSAAGFDEDWRLLNRPDDVHRFPGVHLLARRRS
ncbi:class I SAM-dependent methyltransferase [Mycolicibacterium sp. J2]|uniref:class I SAM-dependent methyltransferase n=1 Tax=Mycolicibacterium sp. J2 TaxID=2993511 RepID=UPI00224AC029|nr:class I SAM-dependent methyltransferase [Mycolicibacterium sp. J2]MCX2713191.1 class I SAM-dependent methyltransferase [Mycolicibacterium sp. J2]